MTQAGLKHVTVRNGLTLAYMVALVNALLALLVSFGLHISQDQQAAVIAFVNAAMLLGARVVHLPERTPEGGVVAVEHVPILVTAPPPLPAEIAAAGPPIPE